jgi:hypothetical protein
MMNIVGYYEVRTREIRKQQKEVRILHTNKNESWFAKCQFKKPDGTNVFGDGNVINPTLPSMMEAISQGRVVSRGRQTVPRASNRNRKGALSGRH